MKLLNAFIHITGLAYKSKLVMLSVVGSLALLGGGGYAVVRMESFIKQPNATSTKTPSISSSSSAKSQTTAAKPTAASSTSTSTAKPSTTSTTKNSTSSSAISTNSVNSGSTPIVTATSSPTLLPSSSGATSNGSCFVTPSSCGYPDASNTGPVAGTVFTKVPEQATSGNGWAWNSGGWVSVTGSNVTVNGIETSGGIDVTGDNVIIQNCKINQPNGMFGVSLRHTTGVTVRNCQIAGTDVSAGRLSVAIKSIYGDDVNPQSIANNISYVSTGIQYCQGLIQDNYIHDLGYQSGDHLNGTTSNSGCNELTIRHNTVFNNFGQTDAISLFEDFGQQMNALITNNYVAGGGYAIYGGANSGGITPINTQITNNRISDYYYPNGGYYGWLAAWDGTGSGNVCSGNVLEHTATGKTDPLSC